MVLLEKGTAHIDQVHAPVDFVVLNHRFFSSLRPLIPVTLRNALKNFVGLSVEVTFMQLFTQEMLVSPEISNRCGGKDRVELAEGRQRENGHDVWIKIEGQPKVVYCCLSCFLWGMK